MLSLTLLYISYPFAKSNTIIGTVWVSYRMTLFFPAMECTTLVKDKIIMFVSFQIVACPQPKQCTDHGGKCKNTCDISGERELIGMCPTTNKNLQCKCCAPKCQDSDCRSRGGFCVTGKDKCPTEDGNYMIIEGCTGYNCACCKRGK